MAAAKKADLKTSSQSSNQDSSPQERIGFHKGSLATLSKEREEMLRILQIVEQLMQMHVQELKKLGVDLVAQAKAQPATKNKKPIEDVLR
ncbi:hypothetical protein HYV86_06455 [Candidatus Woesearchaeota archaeon]|nr:hypothetical protein [Candidatus Woesearchaeota archaeon]